MSYKDLVLLEQILQHLDARTSREPPTRALVHILCEPAQSKCTWTSQEQFYARIYRKNAGGQRAYPDLTPALTPTVRTPLSVAHGLGNNTKKNMSFDPIRYPNLGIGIINPL